MATTEVIVNGEKLPSMGELNKVLAPYQRASYAHGIWQLANTLIPYALLWYLMVLSLQVSYWLTLGLSVLAAGFLVRIFIFFHDCGHNSFFPSTAVNKRVGFWLGVLTFTPSEHWWHSHAIHHATSGNLDKRGTGDVTTLTLEEFYDKAWLQRLGYRFFRNPLVMFVLGPIFMFIIMHRLPTPNYGKRQTLNVHLTNLAILALAVGMSLLIGWQAYLAIQLPVIFLAGMAGIWLFYIQHQFEDTYWDRAENWNYVASALLGASYYRLPRLLEWFSGSIGYHHIHHLSPRIPNYNLAACQKSSPVLQKWARVVTIPESIQAVRLKVWNESTRKLEAFKPMQVEFRRVDSAPDVPTD